VSPRVSSLPDSADTIQNVSNALLAENVWQRESKSNNGNADVVANVSAPGSVNDDVSVTDGVTSPSSLSVSSDRPHHHRVKGGSYSQNSSPVHRGRGRNNGKRQSGGHHHSGTGYSSSQGNRAVNRYSTGNAPSAHYYPLQVDVEAVKIYLLAQIEYYFSVENLCRDIYLRSQMDEEGYVPVEIIAAFNRVRAWTTDLAFLVEVSQTLSRGRYRIATTFL
jgi:la-related protein 1